MGPDKRWQHTVCFNNRILSVTLPARLSNCYIQGCAFTYCAFCSSTQISRVFQTTKCPSQNLAHWGCAVLHHHLLSLCSVQDACVGVILPSASLFLLPKEMPDGFPPEYQGLSDAFGLIQGQILNCSATSRLSLKHFLSWQEVTMDKELLGAKGPAMTA